MRAHVLDFSPDTRHLWRMLVSELTVAQLHGLMVVSCASVFASAYFLRLMLAEDTSNYYRVFCFIGILALVGAPGLWGYEVIVAIGDTPAER